MVAAISNLANDRSSFSTAGVDTGVGSGEAIDAYVGSVTAADDEAGELIVP
jgi:hypothetical protein